MSELKIIRVQSVVFPEHPLPFNEWLEKMNVSVLYKEERNGSGHYYPPPPLNSKPNPFVVRLSNYVKDLML